MVREELIEYIRKNSAFYTAVNFTGHSDEQLARIKSSIDRKKAYEKNKNVEENLAVALKYYFIE